MRAKERRHKKCTGTIFSHHKLKEAEICCYQWCRSVSYWYGFGWGSRMWKNSLRIRIRIQGELWYRSGSRKQNGSGSSKKGLCTRKIFKKCIKKVITFVLWVYYFTIPCLQQIIQISYTKKVIYVFNGFSWIRIRIIWTDPESGSSHFLYGSGSREMIRIPRIRIRNTGC